jgi:hypothetical protein
MFWSLIIQAPMDFQADCKTVYCPGYSMDSQAIFELDMHLNA